MANFNFNKSVIGGRLTAAPELKITPNGVSVCSFSVAVTRKTNREETDFINCVAWRQTAEFISKYFSKGSSICVTGAIQVRRWQDQNGGTRFATEVIVDEAYFVDGKNDAAPSAPAESNTPAVAAPSFETLEDGEELPF